MSIKEQEKALTKTFKQVMKKRKDISYGITLYLVLWPIYDYR